MIFRNSASRGKKNGSAAMVLRYRYNLPCSAHSSIHAQRDPALAVAKTKKGHKSNPEYEKYISLTRKTLTYLGPIHHIPECRAIVGPAVLIVQIVRMFPHV